MRVLEVVRGMNIGGLENVVKNILEYNNKQGVECECLICDLEEQDYEAELVAHRIKIYKIPVPDSVKMKLYRNLISFFKEQGYYDVVHVHMAFTNGVVALAAKKSGMKRVVCHSHGVELPSERRKTARVYQHIMRILMKKYGDTFLACSNVAGEYLFGRKEYNLRGSLFANGIYIDKFQFDEKIRKEVRLRLGIDDKVVLGTVGSLVPVKNQKKILEIAKKMKNVVVLLVGSGSCEEELKKYSYENKVETIFVGKQQDTSRFLHSMDVFVFPSISEGFGIALIEAQANGLPCVVSDAIQAEAKIADNIYTVPLSAGIEKWVDAAWHAYEAGRYEARKSLIKNGLDLEQKMELLFEMYRVT